MPLITLKIDHNNCCLLNFNKQTTDLKLPKLKGAQWSLIFQTRKIQEFLASTELIGVGDVTVQGIRP